MRKLWRFNLIRERRSVVEDIRIAENKEECCRKLITEPLKNAIEKYKIDCLFIGITWDENEGEKFVSEGNVYVHPILHFTERDIWDYIRKYNLPYRWGIIYEHAINELMGYYYRACDKGLSYYLLGKKVAC